MELARVTEMGTKAPVVGILRLRINCAAQIAAQLQAAAQAAAQQQPEGAPQGAVLQLPCMLGHMLAHAAHPATPQGSQAPALQNPTAPHGGPNQARPPS